VSVLFYHDKADALAELYLSLSFEDVHKPWLDYLTELNTHKKVYILDVGAGSGRDARYLAKLRGVDNQPALVVAVEPAKGLAQIGKQTTQGLNVVWVDDLLPELVNVKALPHKYHLVLLSAVWMHLAPIERNQALASLSALMADNGLLVITLRHGECDDERLMYPVSAAEVTELAQNCGLSVIRMTDRVQDTLGRSNVSWQTLVLRKPLITLVELSAREGVEPYEQGRKL
jgi:SAM-dependent methyltransferase